MRFDMSRSNLTPALLSTRKPTCGELGARRAKPRGRAYGVAMRWAALFQDFETQMYAASRADLDAKTTELTRAEAAAIEMSSRFRAAQGTPVRLRLRDGRDVLGVIDEVATQWLLLSTQHGATLIPTHSIDVVYQLRRGASTARSGVLARLGLGHTLRALARDRVIVRVGIASGDVVGWIDQVGSDHMDLLLTHSPDNLRGRRESALVPFPALLCVTEQL